MIVEIEGVAEIVRGRQVRLERVIGAAELRQIRPQTRTAGEGQALRVDRVAPIRNREVGLTIRSRRGRDLDGDGCAAAVQGQSPRGEGEDAEVGCGATDTKRRQPDLATRERLAQVGACRLLAVADEHDLRVCFAFEYVEAELETRVQASAGLLGS